MVERLEPMSWHRPATLEQARALFERFPGAIPMGGGQHLVPAWQDGKVPAAVISLANIAELRNIRLDGHNLHIGAAVTLQELAASPVLEKSLPALASLAAQMGDRLMRNRATLGGALCATGRDGCIPAAMLGTGATVHTTARELTADDWFQPQDCGGGPALAKGDGGAVLAEGHGSSVLAEGEFITGVSLNLPDVATHQCLRLVPGRYALVTVFASRRDGAFCVGISGLTDAAFRATDAEAWLASGQPSDNSLLDSLFAAHPARNDLHATAVYRQAQAKRLLYRAAQELVE